MTEADDERCDEASSGHHDIENVPSIGAETTPAQTKTTNKNVDQIYEHQRQEKII